MPCSPCGPSGPSGPGTIIETPAATALEANTAITITAINCVIETISLTQKRNILSESIRGL
jgi:hypothetical protein